MVDNAYDEMVRMLMAPKKEGGGGLGLEDALEVAERALAKMKADREKDDSRAT